MSKKEVGERILINDIEHDKDNLVIHKEDNIQKIIITDVISEHELCGISIRSS